MTFVVAVCLIGILYAVPNFLKTEFGANLPNFAPGKRVSLGLDLQGGSYLLLKVDLDVVIKEYLEEISMEVRKKLRKARVGYSKLGSTGASVVVNIRQEKDFATSKKLLDDVDPNCEIIFDANGSVKITPREDALNERKLLALQQSIEIVRRRIDETGVREPTIQRQGSDRIIVQLPGVDDPERIKALLGQTAKMVFRLVDMS